MSKQCNVEGCDKKHLARGLCRKHYDKKFRNTEKVKDYYEANKEYWKTYYVKNKEKMQAYQKEYRKQKKTEALIQKAEEVNGGR